MSDRERNPWDFPWAEPGRCRAEVHHRDTYRRVGGPQHFKVHYLRKQCKRKSRDNGYCWQHQHLAKGPPYVD